MKAAQEGRVESIQALVELRADKEAKLDGGSTPLHQAAGWGQADAVKVLVALTVTLRS